MDGESLKSMIAADAFYRDAHGPDSSSAAQPDHKMKKAPGNHVRGIVQKDTLPNEPTTISSQFAQNEHQKMNEDHGRGLAYRQMLRLYEVARKYLPSNSNTDLKEAEDTMAQEEFDRIFQHGSTFMKNLLQDESKISALEKPESVTDEESTEREKKVEEH